ncbi:hypothetical protein BsWGS_14179 [Bradybaena similaris]
MASHSKELEDYWNEFKIIEQANIHSYEDEIFKAPDDGELEADWLGAAGFQSLVSKFQDGKDLSEDELDSLTDTLTQAQAETVRKRINALSTTMRKKNKGNKIHVKDIFPHSDDLSKVDASHPVLTGSKKVGDQSSRPSQDKEADDKNGSKNHSTEQFASLPLVSDLQFHLQERKKVFEPKSDPLGLTLMGDLAECDMHKIKALAHIELTTLFDHYNIVYTRPKRKRKTKEHGIFGVPLDVMVEHDQKRSPGTTVPIVFQAMINFLEKEGLYTEGILRVSRAETRTKQLRQDLEEKFYQGLFSWGDAGPHDVAVVFKQFLRELPVPLLSYNYLDAFHQISNIPKILEQVQALNLLILLLAKEHRDTLKVLLRFLHNIISHSDHNKMSLSNVAMIMAPNLFMAPPRSNKDKPDLEFELKKAAATSTIVKMLIHYQDVLWTIPSAFISQLRHQNTTDANRKSRGMSKLLRKKNKERPDICKKQPSSEQLEKVEGVICVQAPHLNKGPMQIHLDTLMTASDVVAKVKGRNDAQKEDSNKTLEDNNDHNSNNARHFSDYLYEVGGNIRERCLDPRAKVMEVHLINPRADWVIKTRTGRPEIPFPVSH